jgi:hypothetical protein
MAAFKTLTVLALLSLPIAGRAEVWNGSGTPSGAWGVAASWTPTTVPNSATATATFSGSSPLVIILENGSSTAITPEVQTLNFSSVDYTISGSKGTLYLAPGASTAITLTGCSPILDCPIRINNENALVATTLTINVDSGDTLALNNNIVDGSMTIPDAASLSFPGPGQLTTTDSCIALSGGVATMGGTLVFTNGVTSPSFELLCCGLIAGNATMPQAYNNVTLVNTATTATNNANITATSMNIFGCAIFAANDFTIDGGTLNLVNTGTITGGGHPLPNSVGAGLEAVAGTFTVTGGAVLNITDNGSHDAGSFGSAVFVAAGTLDLNNGTIVNNGIIATPTMAIDSAGLLAGGTIAGSVIGQAQTGGFPLLATAVTNSGTVIIGDPVIGGNPGTLTLVGDYINESGGVFGVNLLNTGSFSQLIVSQDMTPAGGTVTLNGGTVRIGLTPGYSLAVTDTFKIIEAATSITGQFSSIDGSQLPPGFIPYLIYSPDPSVILAFLSGPSGAFVCPTLPSYIGGLSQQLFSEITDINIFLKRKIQQLQNRSHREAPYKHSSQRMAARQTSSFLDRPVKKSSLVASVDNRVAASKQEPLAFVNRKGQLQQQAQAKACCRENDRPWNVYLGPQGGLGEVHTHDTQVGFDYHSLGALAGFDYAFAHAGIGLMASYENVRADVHRHWGTFDSNQGHASLYATYEPSGLPQLAFDAIAGGGYEWYRIRRNTEEGTAKGKPRGSEFDALFGLEYTFEQRHLSGMPSGLQIIPMALLQYIYFNVDSYKEHGADLMDLKIHTQNIKSLSSILGFWVNYTWKWTDFAFTLSTDAAWQREYFNKARSLYFAPANPSALPATCPAFTSASGKPTSAALSMDAAKRSTLLAGIDFFLMLYDQCGIEASYDFQWNERFHDHAFYLGFSARF